MKAKNIGAIIITLCLLAVSCKQDPIFFIISTETAPRPPRIEGAPTNMVVFNREYPDPNDGNKKITVPIMYVASGRLHWYATAPGNVFPHWDFGGYPIPQPEGKIISLAVGKDPNDPANVKQRLYALCRDGHGVNAILRYIESDGDHWQIISSHTAEIQSIYAFPETERLFAGAGRGTYAILYLDITTDTLKPLISDSTLLSGAVYKGGTYYLSTRGDGTRGGIFTIAETAFASDPINVQSLRYDEAAEEKDNHRLFISMVKLKDDTIIAVERNGGALYKVSSGSFERMTYKLPDNNDGIATGKFPTEALALWEDTERGLKLLIAGIQGGLYSTSTSSYTHGYVEFELIGDSLNTTAVRHDPGSLQSIDNQDRYTTSLGKHPINHLFQAPGDIDTNRTFFASTQTAGLWSYRDRPDNGGLQWNAEE